MSYPQPPQWGPPQLPPPWGPQGCPLPPAPRAGRTTTVVLAIVGGVVGLCSLCAMVGMLGSRRAVPSTSSPTPSSPSTPTLPQPAQHSALNPLAPTVPTNPEGRRALAQWVHQNHPNGNPWPVWVSGPDNNRLSVTNPRDCSVAWLREHLEGLGMRANLATAGFTEAVCSTRRGTAVFVSMNNPQEATERSLTGCDYFTLNQANNTIEERARYVEYDVAEGLRHRGRASLVSGHVLQLDAMPSCEGRALHRALESPREGRTVRYMCTSLGFTQIRCSSRRGNRNIFLQDVCHCPSRNPEDCMCDLGGP